MKPLRFHGSSLDDLRAFDKLVRADIGYQLERLQRGDRPEDWKPMTSVGPSVEELRVWDTTGTYRAIYYARRADAVHVLHVFQKKTQTTAGRDIETARRRLAAMEGRTR
ncbi:MAG: type II toxin-antitoxin system RelE/ParE family toxin [Tagaea sp.]